VYVRLWERVVVKLFVIRTQSRVRSVIGVSQRGGSCCVCREVSGKKVEGVVLAGLKNAGEPEFAGVLRDSAVF
jgi:hypothetical protein